jgi:quercetin dioxygenase-like cupin family protein
MNTRRTARRIVTGHDAAGRSVIAADTRLLMVPGATEESRTLANIWANGPHDGVPASGTIRVVDIPPGGRCDPHATETVDYAIVLEGALCLTLDTAETELRAGHIVVQRGTQHGWENRADAVARVVFVNLTSQVDAAAV